MHTTLVHEIPAAERRIRGLVAETPLIHAPGLSERTGARVLLKLENRQHTGSFKLRGATNKLLRLSPEERARGVVTASTGNHGLAVAHAASRLDVPAAIYLPESASPQKVAKLRTFPVELCFTPGADGVRAEVEARRVAEETGRVFVSPYNDLDVIAGQGTIAVELLRQEPALDAVFVAVGGGGLISGVAAHLKAGSRPVQVIGCQPVNSPVMLESIRAGHIVDMESLPTLSDGTAGGIEADAITFDLCRSLVDDWIVVTEEEIAAAMDLVLQEHGEVIEGAAGVAVAALLRTGRRFAGQNVAVIICGGNVVRNA